MRRHLILVGIVIFNAVSLWASDAAALRLGPVNLDPYIDSSAIYDDNIFVQSDNTVADYYFIISPGLLMQRIAGENQYELEYRADIYRYIDTGEANDVEDHNLRVGISIQSPSRLSLGLSDLAKRDHESRSEQNFGVVQFTQPNKYWSNDLEIAARYAISEKFSLGLAYRNYCIDYELVAENFRDRMDNGVGASAYYRFMPKTSLLVEGIYKNVDHLRDNAASGRNLDSDEYWAMAGLTWDVTAKSTGTVKVGYEWKRPDSSVSKNFGSPIYMVSVNHTFTPKTSASISGRRQTVETDDPQVAYYTMTQCDADVTYKPTLKIKTRLYGSWARNSYANDTVVQGDAGRRVDKIWAGGLDLSYQMNRWFTFTTGYSHTKRISTLPIYDYTDNMVMVGIKITL